MRRAAHLTRRVALSFAAAFALAPPALAHSVLRRASPAEGSVNRAPVTAISLIFSQGVEAALSKATLKREGVTVFEGRAFDADPKDRASLILPFAEALAPGRYSLEWRVMSIDTHRIEGRLGFEVRP